MKRIISITIVALCSIALAGCWFYSRPDTATGCQKTTYGAVTSTTTTETCPPDEAGKRKPPPQAPPPLPPPSMP